MEEYPNHFMQTARRLRDIFFVYFCYGGDLLIWADTQKDRVRQVLFLNLRH
jgi:hypothetical protein